MPPYKRCAGALVSSANDIASLDAADWAQESRESCHTTNCCRNFISGFAHRLNQLSLAKMAVTVAQDISSPEEAVTFLQEVSRLAVHAAGLANEAMALNCHVALRRGKQRQGLQIVRGAVTAMTLHQRTVSWSVFTSRL